MSSDNGFYIETIHEKYHGKDPVFFDKSEFEWVKFLENDYEQIMKSLEPVFTVDFDELVVNPETHLQFPPKLWKGYAFYFNGIKFKKNLSRFPYIAQKLKSIPNLITATISVLEPGAALLPHNGSTNGVMRVHFPLKIPGTYPDCGMIIEGHEISWKQGEIIIFCDMKMHAVRNLTDERRYILLLDIVRTEYAHIKKKICVHTIARIITNIFLNIGRSIFKK